MEHFAEISPSVRGLPQMVIDSINKCDVDIRRELFSSILLVTLKPEAKGLFSSWIKAAFRGGKKEIQESIHEKLNFSLSTAPTWDRLELKDNKYVLGEFLEFKGNQEDLLALRNIKRSKVSRLVVQKTSMFGLAPSTLQILYSTRDYRIEGASSSDWKEITVRSSTKTLF